MKFRRILGVALGATLISGAAMAQPLFYDNFDADHTANWQVNNGPTDSNVDAFFDYSTLGIPTAPRSSGGTTRGMRFLANQTNGIFGGVSASPIGGSFTGDYTLAADVWLNFNGPAPVGGSGSTQVAGMGILTNGTTAQWPGSTQNGVFFMSTTDGNSSVDYRAYSSAAPTGYVESTGVFFAGNTTGARNHNHAYYAQFGGIAPPPAQTALFPQQTGNNLVGSLGFAWRDWVVRKVGNIVTWSVDGLPIARVDITGVTTGGNNILLNFSDTNLTSSTDPNDFLICGIFDNVQVVPEPGTMAALGIGALALIRRRRK